MGEGNHQVSVEIVDYLHKDEFFVNWILQNGRGSTESQTSILRIPFKFFKTF